MEIQKEKFHFLSLSSGESLVVYEPEHKIYVWIQLKIPRPLQGKNRAIKMIEVGLRMLTGTHYIDFDPNIKSFLRIAKIKNWKRLGKSCWFDNCIAYVAKTRKRRKEISQTGIIHKTQDKPMKVSSFVSQRELKAIIRDIKQYFLNERT